MEKLTLILLIINCDLLLAQNLEYQFKLKKSVDLSTSNGNS